jgi:enoyl-CoA hydratase
LALGMELAALPQTCMRNDRASALAQWSNSEADAIAAEFSLGALTLQSGETIAGAARFASGAGRGGRPVG